MSWPTVRRFPRTLGEAFPRDPKHACPVERPRKSWISLTDLIGAVVVAALAAAVLLHALGALFV